MSLLDDYDIDDPNYDLERAARELPGQLGKAGEEYAAAKRELSQLTLEFGQWQSVARADYMYKHPKHPQWRVDNHLNGQPQWRKFTEAVDDAKQRVGISYAVEKAIELKAKFVLALLEHG